MHCARFVIKADQPGHFQPDSANQSPLPPSARMCDSIRTLFFPSDFIQREKAGLFPWKRMRKVRQYGFHLRPALAVRPASQRQFKQMEHKRQDGLLDPYPANWHA